MPDFSDQSSPGKKLSCMEMLQLIIDGDATPEQQEQFMLHIEVCMPCFKSYHLDMALKTLLKSKCSGNGAPPDLIEKIKVQISQNMPH
jgi:anti-sigma factor (TIGR02949 family)